MFFTGNPRRKDRAALAVNTRGVRPARPRTPDDGITERYHLSGSSGVYQERRAGPVAQPQLTRRPDPGAVHDLGGRRGLARGAPARADSGRRTAGSIRDQRVSTKSAYQWRWRWRAGGQAAMASKGPGWNARRLEEAQQAGRAPRFSPVRQAGQLQAPVSRASHARARIQITSLCAARTISRSPLPRVHIGGSCAGAYCA